MTDEPIPQPESPHETHETGDSYSGSVTKFGKAVSWTVGATFAVWVAYIFISFFLEDARIRRTADMAAQEKKLESDIKQNERVAAATEESARANQDSAKRLATIEALTTSFNVTNRTIDETVKAVKESQNQACVAAQQASKHALIAAKLGEGQTALLAGISKTGIEQTKLTRELLEEQKKVPSAIAEMGRLASEERKGFWAECRKRDETAFDNQKKIMERLPQPAKPEPPKP